MEASIPGLSARRLWPSIVTIGVTMLALVAGLYGAARTISFNSFGEIEQIAAAKDAERIRRAYAGELEALETVAADWAPWDDSYAFVAGDLPDYPEINLSPDTLDNLGVHFMIFYDADGTLVHVACRSPESGVGCPTSAESAAYGVDERLRPGADTEVGSSGLLMSERGVLMYATAPITTSLMDLPPNGMLLVGRYLDDDTVAEIAQATQLDVSLVPADSLELPSSTAETVTVEVVDADVISGTYVMSDGDGAPVAALRVRMPRPIMREGERAIALFGIALAALGLVCAGVIVWVFRREYTAMSAQVRAESDARHAQDRYRALVDTMADAVLGIDAEGRVYFANPRAGKLMGRPVAELVGVHYRDLLTPDSAAQIAQYIQRDRDALATWEATLADSRGNQIPVEIGVSWFQAADGEAAGMQWVARDVAERKRFEHELVHLATHDFLTGLFNRMRFEEELEGRLASAIRSGNPAVLLWLDLDNFKEVNDSLGHKAGDDILVSMAVGLTRCTRGDTVIARLGGDEFGVLMPQVERGEVEDLANRVLEEIRSMELMTEGRRVRLTPSIGVVVLPDHATTSEEALTRADLAMYRAKNDGRNRVCVYRPDEGWEQELRARFDWAVAIESSLREDKFVVHWQPIIDLESGALDRYELLVRMRAEDGALVLPGSFLPVAEHLGLIGAIDAYMIKRAVGLLLSSDEGVRIDVNLSGRALSDPTLLDLLARETQRAGIDPGRLGIEITETAAVIDMIRARAFIEGLKSVGVRVTLDDFGSGFSSFYYLRNLPIDALKIDGTFVRELASNSRDQHVVRSIVELARGLGIATTAECVENQKTLDLLRSFGISHAQGFHIARPGPVADRG